MLPIIAIGTHPSSSISALCNALSQHGGVFYVDHQKAYIFGIGAPKFLLQHIRKPAQLQVHNAILLPGKLPKGYPLHCSGNFTLLQMEGNFTPSDVLKQHCSHLIRCGMREDDDISFASVGEQQAVLSVARELKTLHGRSILPGDVVLHCRTSRGAAQNLLAGACILLSSGMPQDTITILP